MAIARQSAQTPAPDWRDLGIADTDAVYALHIAATALVARPELVRPETRAFFEAILSGGGRICGTFDADGLLAYGVLQTSLPPAEDLRSTFGLAPEAPFAKLAGAAVRPGFWGGGLHEASIAHRVGIAAERGLTHLYATSAPGNWRSWTNLLDQRFGVRALREQYGGQLRYIVYCDLGSGGEPIDGAGQWCDVGDIAAQRQCLEAGLVGACWRIGESGRREILYRPLP